MRTVPWQTACPWIYMCACAEADPKKDHRWGEPRGTWRGVQKGYWEVRDSFPGQGATEPGFWPGCSPLKHTWVTVWGSARDGDSSGPLLSARGSRILGNSACRSTEGSGLSLLGCVSPHMLTTQPHGGHSCPSPPTFLPASR